MTAKEYLNQIRTLDVIIEQKKMELDNLHDIATSIGSFDYSKDRVQTSPKGEAPYTKNVERIIEKTREMNELMDRYHTMIDWMNKMSAGILTDDEWDIMRFRYYFNWKWDEIEQVMNQSERTLYRIHNQMLKKLQDIVVPVDMAV